MSGPHNKQNVPFHKAVAVVKSDVTVIPKTRGIYIGVGGTLVVTMDGETVTILEANQGIVYDIAVTQVLALTAATDMLALY